MPKPKRIKVRKRNGMWEVNPNGVGGFADVYTHDTYQLAVFDLDSMRWLDKHRIKKEGVE